MIIKLTLSEKREYTLDEAIKLIQDIDKLHPGTLQACELNLKGYGAGAK